MHSLADSQKPEQRSRYCCRWTLAVTMLAYAMAMTTIAVIAVNLQADEVATTASAEAGGEVPSFYVRAVTGPLAGKSVCYVCRNGDRPAVIVLLRELGADSAALLRDLDQLVNRSRAQGLRCFAVLLTENPQRDAARLQTLAFDEKISLPLTLASHAALQGSALAFPRESAVSVITYTERKIVQQFSFRSGSCDEKSRQSILAASQKLLATD